MTDVQFVVSDPLEPGTVYCGADGSVYRSTSSGESWQRLGIGALDLIVHPAGRPLLLAARGIGGARRSYDNGETWQAINRGFPEREAVTVLAADPMTGTRAYAATEGVYDGSYQGKLYWSDDDGTQWHAGSVDHTPYGLDYLAVDGLHPGTAYAANFSAEILRTHDGGATWVYVSGKLPRGLFALAVAPTLPGYLYVYSGGGLHESRDEGEHWQRLAGSPDTPRLIFDPLL